MSGTDFNRHIPIKIPKFNRHVPIKILKFNRHEPIKIFFFISKGRSTPVAQLAPRNLLTRWDVSSIPANGIFLPKN